MTEARRIERLLYGHVKKQVQQHLDMGLRLLTHGGLLARMRGASGLLLDRARAQVRRLREQRADLAAASRRGGSAAETFLTYLLLREQDEALGRLLDLLAIVGDAERVRAVRGRISSGDAATRRSAAMQRAEACPDATELVDEILPWIVELTRDGGCGARGGSGRRGEVPPRR